MQKEFTFAGTDGKEIYTYNWIPECKIRGIIQISHGMAEHSARYCRFAEFMNNKGFAVFANDHRGHGKTAGNKSGRGFFAEKNGWKLCVDDMHQLTNYIKKEHPELPVFLLGHSMGSFLSRHFITSFGNQLKGCILSGTASHSPIILAAGSFIASIQILFFGIKHPSKLLNKMSFGAFNKRVPSPSTPFDWLSCDKELVQHYIADDYCGFICSAAFFRDLFSGLKYINNHKNIQKTPIDLPLYFIYGSEDPVGNYGQGVDLAVSRYKNSGIKDITVKKFVGGRHEILNELNKEEVFQNILEWMELKLINNSDS